jgi:hypothetical protein
MIFFEFNTTDLINLGDFDHLFEIINLNELKFIIYIFTM